MEPRGESDESTKYCDPNPTTVWCRRDDEPLQKFDGHPHQAPGNERAKSVDFEAVLDAIGKPGCFQMIQIVLINTCVIAYVFILVNSVFTTYEPPHKCQQFNQTEMMSSQMATNTSDVDIHYESCYARVIANTSGKTVELNSIQCSSHRDYLGGKYVSMVTEWDLACESKGLAELTQIAVMVGVLVGSIISTPLADRYGRKKVLVVCNVLTIAFELGVVFSPNIFVVICLRFFSGIFGVGTGLVAFVLGGELLVSRYRQIYGSFRSIVWSFCIMGLAGIAYFLRYSSWRFLQMTTALGGIIPLVCLVFVHESPIWLLANHSYHEVYEIIKKASLFNGKQMEDIERVFDSCIENTKHYMKNIRVGEKTKLGTVYNVLEIFRQPILRKITIILGITWFTCNISYFGLYLTSGTLPGNRFLVFFVMAATEVPSCLLTPIIIRFTGRRSAILILLASSVVCLLVSACLMSLSRHSDGSQTTLGASVAFYILGKFTTSSCFIALIVFTLELYPTTLRSSGSGICIVCSTIGGAVAPSLASLSKTASWGPGTILASMNLITFFLVPLLPETKEKQLPISVNDISDWVKGSNYKKGVGVLSQCVKSQT